MRRAAPWVWAFALAAAGCGTSGGGGGSCGSGLGFDAGTAACNTIPTVGACVAYQSAYGTPPAATGGTIASGTYVLTSLSIYGDTPNNALSETLSLTDVTATSLTYGIAVVSGTETIRYEGGATIAGTTITLTPACPAGATPTSAEYTAAASTLTLFQGNEEAIFTQQ